MYIKSVRVHAAKIAPDCQYTAVNLVDSFQLPTAYNLKPTPQLSYLNFCFSVQMYTGLKAQATNWCY